MQEVNGERGRLKAVKCLCQEVEKRRAMAVVVKTLLPVTVAYESEKGRGMHPPQNCNNLLLPFFKLQIKITKFSIVTEG